MVRIWGFRASAPLTTGCSSPGRWEMKRMVRRGKGAQDPDRVRRGCGQALGPGCPDALAADPDWMIRGNVALDPDRMRRESGQALGPGCLAA